MHDIRPFLPQLFSNPGTLLYIGARSDAHSWLDELSLSDNLISVLEIWPENVIGLIGHPAIVDLVQGDVRFASEIFNEAKFDYIFYWHGPEHLKLNDIEPTLAMLEGMCNRLIALACPYGVYLQGEHLGNEYETHQSTLYPEYFLSLGYEVKTDGKPDEMGSEIVAWKALSD